MSRLASLLYCTCLAVYVWAKPIVAPDDLLSVEDGLTQGMVRCVVQDPRGLMWFGTQDGLNRYDGHDFRRFGRKPFDNNSLSSDDVGSLHQVQNRLWVGTSNGLNYIDTYTGQMGRVSVCEGLQVVSVVQAANGTLIVATPNDIWEVNHATTHAKKTLIAPWKGHNRLKTDAQRNVWLASDAGLFQIITARLELVHRFEHPILDFQIDHLRRCWVLTQKGVFLKQGNDFQRIELSFDTPNVRPTRLMVDRFGVLWVGTAASGVYLFDAQLTLLKHTSLGASSIQNSAVIALYEAPDAHQDIVWIGTREVGVYKYCRSKNVFTPWHVALSNEKSSVKSFFGISQDQNGHLWTGTMGGLVEFDKSMKPKIHLVDPKNQHSNEVQAVLHSRRGQVWVGTNAGLFQKTDRGFVPFPFSSPAPAPTVLKLYEDNQQNIWVGTVAFLAKIAQNQVVEKIHEVLIGNTKTPIGAVADIKQDALGQYWISTSKGLFLKKVDGTFRHFTHQPSNRNSLLDNLILSVVLDLQQRVWVCTPKGITKITQNADSFHFQHFTEQNGLANTFVYGGLSDSNGKLWFSTNHGLSCFDPQHASFKHFEGKDGLGLNEFNSGSFFKNTTGELFFGGAGGLVSFRPTTSLQNQHLPRTVVTSFKILGVEQNLDSLLTKNKRLELRHDQNFVSFRLAATDYTNPAQNQYAYRLEGSDNQWIELGHQPDVNFANLSDGSYTLHLKSANNQGVWNDKDNFSLPLIVHPPWWRTGWFYGLGLLFLLGLVWSIYTLRINQLLALERAKNEENERVRQMAAQDIHDEFGNSLTRISLLSELVKNQIKKEKPAEALNLLAKISDNSQRLYQGTKDFIWAINTDHDNLYEVAIRIKDYCEEVLDKNQIRFDCDGIGQHLIEKKLAAGTSRQVVMIFKEATTNTLKHAQATAVKLYFETEGPRVYIVWQDNGQGITAAKTNGQGIENMHTRAAKIKADFRIESKIHKGTTVKLGI